MAEVNNDVTAQQPLSIEERIAQNTRLLNQYQSQLLPNNAPDMSAFEFKPPENLQQAVGNVFRHGVANPVMESLGLRESLKDVFEKERVRGQVAANEVARRQIVTDELRRQQLLMMLTRDPFNLPLDRLSAFSVEQLQNIMINARGEPKFNDKTLSVVQENLLTGEMTQIAAPPGDVQTAIYETGLIDNPRGPASVIDLDRQRQLATGQAQDQIALSQTNRTEADNIIKAAYLNAQNRAETAPMLMLLQSILTDEALRSPNVVSTGKLANIKQAFREYGLALNLNVENPTGLKLFDAISNQYAIPSVKRLGTNPTDTDLKLILDTMPNLENTPEGNMILIQVELQARERANKIQQFIQAYQTENIKMYKEDGTQFLIGLRDGLAALRRSDDYLNHKSIMQLKAQANNLLRTPEPDVDELVDTLFVGPK
tara:strand:+ start:239 stop:1522 length:1284 start_codon:yes stop_codon:yes gene_type:complete